LHQNKDLTESSDNEVNYIVVQRPVFNSSYQDSKSQFNAFAKEESAIHSLWNPTFSKIVAKLSTMSHKKTETAKPGKSLSIIDNFKQAKNRKAMAKATSPLPESQRQASTVSNPVSIANNKPESNAMSQEFSVVKQNQTKTEEKLKSKQKKGETKLKRQKLRADKKLAAKQAAKIDKDTRMSKEKKAKKKVFLFDKFFKRNKSKKDTVKLKSKKKRDSIFDLETNDTIRVNNNDNNGLPGIDSILLLANKRDNNWQNPLLDQIT
jgi:hypothetical protein